MSALIYLLEEYARRMGMQVRVYQDPNHKTAVCVYLTEGRVSIVLTICNMGELLLPPE